MVAFDDWWSYEGRNLGPIEEEDVEAFTKRISKIAWGNGAFCAQATRREMGVNP